MDTKASASERNNEVVKGQENLEGVKEVKDKTDFEEKFGF